MAMVRSQDKTGVHIPNSVRDVENAGFDYSQVVTDSFPAADVMVATMPSFNPRRA
jgi:hypothetical protein